MPTLVVGMFVSPRCEKNVEAIRLAGVLVCGENVAVSTIAWRTSLAAKRTFAIFGRNFLRNIGV